MLTDGDRYAVLFELGPPAAVHPRTGVQHGAVDRVHPGGDEARTAIMNALGQNGLRLTYWFEQTGTDDAPETGDDLVVEYQNYDLKEKEGIQPRATGVLIGLQLTLF